MHLRFIVITIKVLGMDDDCVYNIRKSCVKHIVLERNYVLNIKYIHETID